MRNDLEDRFRTLVLDEDLPTPRFNETIELDELTIEADVVWPDHKLIVELDGYAAHGTRSQFEADRARDRAAHMEGWLVIRYTDVDPAAAAQLRKLLSERMRPRSGRPRFAAPLA